MSTCSNCGKVMGLHSSILQGCMCQYSMQAPPQRTWVGLTQEELCEIVGVSTNDSDWNVYKVQEWLRKVEAKLKQKNTKGEE